MDTYLELLLSHDDRDNYHFPGGSVSPECYEGVNRRAREVREDIERTLGLSFGSMGGGQIQDASFFMQLHVMTSVDGLSHTAA